MSLRLEKTLHCGVKFCGGCNPRYERRQALADLEQMYKGSVCFDIAKEHTVYDLLLVIGGCSNCCASYDEYKAENGIIKMWDKTFIEDISSKIEQLLIVVNKSAG